MAIDVNAFAKAIRISVGNPEAGSNELADATRILAFCAATIDNHVPPAALPEAVRDMAIVQLGQYVYDAPIGQRYHPLNMLANSGVRAMLAPYRVHRAGVDVDAVAASTGVDRDAVIAIVNDLLPSWVEMDIVPIPIAKLSALPQWARDNVTLIPAGKLSNQEGGATPAQVALIVQALSRITNLEHFESALRTSGSFNHPRLLFNVAISRAAYRPAGNPSWPVDNSDQEIKVSVNPSPSGITATATFDLTTILALQSILPSTQMGGTNAVSFAPSDGSNKFYLGRSDKEILFSADNIGSYYVSLTDTEIDIEPWARISNSDPLPSSKLVNAPRAAGLSRTDVNNIVDGRVADWAEEGSAASIPANKLGNVPATKPEFTDEQRAVFEAFTGDDVWRPGTSDLLEVSRTGSATIPTADPNTLQYASGLTDISPRVVNRYYTIKVPNSKASLVSKGLLRLAVRPAQSIRPNQSLPYGYIRSDRWIEDASADTANKYYYTLVADVPVGNSIGLDEFHPTEINPDRVSNFYVPASWARQGDTSPIPKSKVSVLEQLATQRYSSVYGASITSLNADRRFGTGSSMVAFNPALTLTSSDHGLLLVTVQWNVAPDSTPRVALGDDVTGGRNIAFHEIVALDDYAVASLNGLLVDAVDVHAVSSGSRGAKQGVAGLYIGKTSTGEVGFFVNYDADSGATSVLQGNIQAHIDVFSIPSGAPAAASSGGVTYEVVKDWFRYLSNSDALTSSQMDKLFEDDVVSIVLDVRQGPSYSNMTSGYASKHHLPRSGVFEFTFLVSALSSFYPMLVFLSRIGRLNVRRLPGPTANINTYEFRVGVIK